MNKIIEQIAQNNPMLAEYLIEIDRPSQIKLIVRYIEGLQNLLIFKNN